MTDNVVKFTDVPDNHWGLGSIIWGQKFIDGYADNLFKPNHYITRAEMVSMLHKYHRALHENLKSSLVKEIKPSVVVIKNTYTDKDGQVRTSIGTGTVINEQGDILTNYHVVADDQQKITGTLKIGVLEASPESNLEQIKYYEGKYYAGDSWIDQDMALVYINHPNLNLPYMPIAKENLVEGDDVISYGHGGGYIYAVGDGVIAQDLQVVGGIATFGQTDANINSGNSGGLISSIYNKAIAGIPTRKATQYDNISFYVPASRIIEFLDKHETKYYLA